MDTTRKYRNDVRAAIRSQSHTGREKTSNLPLQIWGLVKKQIVSARS
jgi:hypothetical protein